MYVYIHSICAPLHSLSSSLSAPVYAVLPVFASILLEVCLVIKIVCKYWAGGKTMQA